MLSPDTLHHQEEVNSALDRQIRQDIQDMAQEAQIQAQIIAHEGEFCFVIIFLCLYCKIDFSPSCRSDGRQRPSFICHIFFLFSNQSYVKLCNLTYTYPFVYLGVIVCACVCMRLFCLGHIFTDCLF